MTATERSAARRLADDYWTYRVQNRHFLNLLYGELRFLDQWNDQSAEGIQRFRDDFGTFAETALTTPSASAEERILLDTVAAAARYDRDSTTWWSELEAPNLQSGLISILFPSLAMQPLASEDDGNRYLEKLRRFPALVEQLTERLEEGRDAGRVPLRLHVEQTLGKIDDLLGRPMADDPLMAQAAPHSVDGETSERFRAGLWEAIEGSFRPGLARFAEALRAITLEAGRPEHLPGLCHVEGGDDVYAAMVAAHTTTDLTPQEIHEIGLEEIDRLERAYVAIGGPLLGTMNVTEIYERLREDPALHYTSVDDLVADSVRCLEKATAAMGEWFDPVPKAGCVASATEFGAMAFYRPPPLDGSAPGQFFFNVADPGAWATFQIPAVAYHEGIPGHHLQFALGIENDRVHDLHRLIYLSSFGEGWGLYTEQLADEMGLYEDDWERLGMLMADSMRAGRLVVDTGMHALGWSRQQAIDYLADHSPMAMHEIREEIDRYIASPGQALSYMIGRREIQAIRAAAERTMGERFDIKEFHGVVLGNGTVPLPTLRRMVEDWSAA